MNTEIKVDKRAIVERLWARDGDVCCHPDCDEKLVRNAQGKKSPTIEHWYPVSWCKEQGWTFEEIWDDSNLKLAHKSCNARKGNLVPNEDGTLPDRPVSRFVYRRQRNAQRPEICTSCNAGRNLGPNEVCAACNSGPQPDRFPRWAKVPVQDCDHAINWCWCCSSGLRDRVGATEMIMLHGEGGE